MTYIIPCFIILTTFFSNKDIAVNANKVAGIEKTMTGVQIKFSNNFSVLVRESVREIKIKIKQECK